MVDVFRGYAEYELTKIDISSTCFGRLFRRDAPLYGHLTKPHNDHVDSDVYIYIYIVKIISDGNKACTLQSYMMEDLYRISCA